MTGSSFAQTTTTQPDKKPRTERAGKGTQAKSPEERAAKRTEMLAKKYHLSAAQQTQLTALHTKQQNEKTALRGQRGTKTEVTQQQREAMKARQDQYNQELKAILTPQQYAQYEADRQTKGNGERRGNKKGLSKNNATGETK